MVKTRNYELKGKSWTEGLTDAVLVDLDCPVVHLSHGLHLQVVTVAVVRALAVDILLKVLCHKLREVISIFQLQRGREGERDGELFTQRGRERGRKREEERGRERERDGELLFRQRGEGVKEGERGGEVESYSFNVGEGERERTQNSV